MSDVLIHANWTLEEIPGAYLVWLDDKRKVMVWPDHQGDWKIAGYDGKVTTRAEAEEACRWAGTQ